MLGKSGSTRYGMKLPKEENERREDDAWRDEDSVLRRDLRSQAVLMGNRFCRCWRFAKLLRR